MSAKQALRELRANSGTQFNPVVVEAFIKTVVGERRKSARGTESPQEQVYQQAVEAVRVSL
jgi:HD-GYP domain-containing protein (c-di-GMP phosphodiesterase class II)